MERLNFRGSSQLALLAELRERDLLREVGDPATRLPSIRARREVDRGLFGRIRLELLELLRPAC